MKDHFKGRRLFYGLILFFIALSGFAQMPVFDRYYVSAIPGLGWLANFYVTLNVHYIMAALLLALGAYTGLDSVLRRSTVGKAGQFTSSGRVKLICLAGLGVTGGGMVVKNLSGVYFPHSLIILLNLVHLFFCMVLLGATLYSGIRKRPWLVL